MTSGRSELFLDVATELLSRGRRVRFRAEGGSMHPTIRGGEAIIVEPVSPSDLESGAIALHHSRRGITAHRVVAIHEGSGREPVFITRGDNVGSADEPVQSRQILGRVVAVERQGRSVDLVNRIPIMKSLMSTYASGLKRSVRMCTANRWLRSGLFLLFVLVFAGIGGQAAWGQSVPTVTSDKADYHPGETVTLTGTGWAPNEAVTIVMTVDPATHGPVTLTSKSDDHGNFTNSAYIVQQSDLGVTFHVTAAALSSGLTAQTTFTDSIGTPVGIGTAGYGSYSYISSLPVTVTSPGAAVNDTVIVAIVLYNDQNPTVTVSDNYYSTNYTPDADVTNSNGTRTLIFSERVPSGLPAGYTITVALSTSAQAINASAFSVSGLVAASPRDKTATATGTSTTPSVGPTATTGQASELLIGAFGLDVATGGGSPTFTAGAGYTALPANVVYNVWGIYPEYQIVSATGAYSANGTWSGGVLDWSGAIVTYKALIVAPTLTSPTATSITSTTATLGATITSDGSGSITARGTCWGTSPTPRASCVAEGGTATGVFAQARTSLTAGTLLYYAGYATNSAGTGYSPDGSFYTEPLTQASGVNFTSITPTGMTVNWTRGSGNGVIVLMKAGSAVNSDPVDGTYTGYTASATFGSGTQIGTGNYVIYKSTGTSVAVTGLTVGTTYYVAVYEYAGAIDTSGVNQGTNYKSAPATGNQATSVSAPTLTSPTATAIASTTATLGANITSNGGASITARGTCWGTSPAPRGNCAAEGGTATGVFTQARTSLTAGTLLYYAGYATNSAGTGYSPDGSFYTEPLTQASGVNFTSVTGTGMTVNWTRGSGNGVIVLMKAGSAVDANPVDGTYTGYTASATFGSGTLIGTGNYVIYKSTGTSVAVTGLTPATAYYVAVYEYAGTVDTSGVNQGTNYLTPAATGNQATVGNACTSGVTAWRSSATGNWGTAGTWECFVSSAWQSSTSGTPGTGVPITISTGNTVTVAASVSANNVTINSGGQVTVASGVVWTLAAGTGLTVNGTVVNAGTMTMTGTAAFNAGSLYQHSQDGGTIPTATWDVASTVAVTGVISTAPGGVGQSFGNFTWNSPGQNTYIYLGGSLTTVRGNFTLVNTGPYTLSLDYSTGFTLNIGGDLIVQGGNLDYTTYSSPTINLAGNYNQTGGTVGYGAISGNTTFNFTGAGKTFTLSAGTFNTANVNLNVNNGASLTLNNGLAMASGQTMAVQSGGTLNTATSVVSGAGTFTLASGGTLGIGSTAGITTVGNATGNIQTTTARNFDVGANYTYNGGVAQVTGNGLPATVANLTVSVGGTYVTLTNGLTVTTLTTVDTGTVLDQNCTLALSSGSLTVSGSYINCNSTSAGGTGTLTLGSGGVGGLTVNGGGSFDYVGTGTITLGGNVSNSGAVRVWGTTTRTGGTPSCITASRATIASSPATTSRNWTGSGMFTMVSLNVTYQAGTAPITVYNTGTFANNGANWTSASTTCAGPPAAPTLVRFHAFSAVPQDGGVLLRWRSGYEVDNLGFHVYRDGVRLTPSLVAGSALLAGRTALTAGNAYTWFDAEGTASSTYTIEDLDLSGVKAVNGPFGVEPAPAAPSRTSRAAAGSRPTRADAADVADAPSRSRLIGELGRPGSGASRWFHTSAVDGAAGDVTAAAPPPAADAPSGPPVALAGGQALGATATAGTATTQITASQTRQQYTLASGKAVKLGVRQEGWYHVDAGQLTAAGMPASASPAMLQLFVNGQEQDLLVSQQGGRVTAVEFYATGVDTPWSDTQVYWLTWGAQVGQRIQATSAKAKGTAPTSFPFTVAWTPRLVSISALNTGDADSFFGPVLTPDDPVTQVLPVTHLSAGTPGASTLQVRMQGATAGPHVVQVTLNGLGLGSLVFADQESGVASFAVPTASLAAGATLTLTAQGAGNDVTLVDTVTLTYPHLYAADGDTLRCTASAGPSVKITGFSSSQVRVMDITDPANVTAPQGTVAPQPGGGYAITVVPSGGGTRTLLAFTAAQMEPPASVEANQPSSWHTAQAGATLVILSHGDFVGSLAPLVALRRAQGLKVAVVDVEDVYDEFSFGGSSPYAVKSFLATASTAWKTKPRWVLLVGDATLDPRDYLGSHQVNYVPVELVATAQLRTVSDDWFVDFDLDGVPELAIGRLPVQAASDAAALVAKIVAYDQAGAAAWKNQALLVAGANDADDDFEGNIAAVKALLPAKMHVTQILQGSDPNAAGDVLAALNSGQGLVNFSGHGSVEIWEGDLFTSDAASVLSNGGATPFVVSMTCLNGFFGNVGTFSLAEAVLEAPGGGAVGVWASSGLTELPPQATLNQAMITALYGGGSITVGEAAVAAKKAVSDPDVRRTWILFGDPSMKIR